MSSGCGDVLSLTDLQTAKKHHIFEAEVITGKQGGVASGADIDFATNQATGQTQKTLPAVLRDAGFRPAAFTFATGGTLGVNGADLAVLWPGPSGDGNYYAWKGALPKTIPAGSTPSSTGGVGSTAWVAVSEAALRADLAKNTGATLIGNGNDTVNNFLYHTPEEFTGTTDAALNSSLAATAADGRSTWIKGTKSLTSSLSVPANVKVLNDGTLSSSGSTAAVQLLSGTVLKGGRILNTAVASAVQVGQGANNAKMSDVTASGAVTSATTPAYAVGLYQADDFTIKDANLSGYTGAINLQQTNRAVVQNITAKNMFYHGTGVAGGYGVLTGGANDTIVNGLQFVSGDTNTAAGYTGRHAIYHSVLRINDQHYPCTNAIFNNVIANYRDKTVESAGGINIRQNTRAIYSNVIIDGSHVSGNTEDGNITSQVFSQGIVRTIKRAEGVNKYGFSWGASSAGNYTTGNITANSIISVDAASGVSTTNCYAYEVTGRNHLIGNLIVDVPADSTPFIVRPDVTNVIISDIMDPVSSPTAPFILFEGGSNITLKGIKTNRSMFGGIFNVTDLTVDFPRTSRISINSNVVATSDNNALFSTITTSATGIVVTFRNHVTQAAVDNAIATIGKTTAPNMPIIIGRGAKSLIIEFYALNGGGLVNPQTTPINFSITTNT